MRKLESSRRVGRTQQPLVWETDYVAAEQNLETIGFFSARYTRPSIRNEKDLSKIVNLSDGRRMEIVPAAKYGFPNAEDLDFYRAFLKICDERAEFIANEEEGKVTYHPRLPSPIGFSTREIIAKAGKVKNGRGHIAVRNWIERLSSTTIHGELFDAKARKYDVRIGLEPLFRQYVHVGRPMSDGEPAAQNYVWLANWFVNNYYHLYARRVDLKFHHCLSHAISKTLYPLLDSGWYAASGGPYTKRYTDLCTLLGIKAYKQLSKARYQLDPSNEELMREQFVGRYDYPLNEAGEWAGTVRWWPGPKWLYDQEARQRQRQAREAGQYAATGREQKTIASEVLPQLALPLPTKRDQQLLQIYEQRVKQFYTALGQTRPSREKLQMGVAVLRNLVEEQNYTVEEVDFTLEWVVCNVQTRFNGRVQSLGILPHVIGEALQERAGRERQQERARLREQRAKEVQDDNIVSAQAVAARLEAIPSEERDRLRIEAIRSLTEQGFQRQFLLENLIKIEMVRLLDGETR